MGLAFLWVPLLALPIAITLQYLCARITLSTGKALGGVMRDNYPALVRPALVCLFIANTLETGANLAVMTEAVNIIAPVNRYVVIAVIALGALFFQFAGTYDLLRRTFKWLTLALLAYVAAGILSETDVRSILVNTFTPSLEFGRQGLSILVALLGAALSPYVFFWFTTQLAQERKPVSHSLTETVSGSKKNRHGRGDWNVFRESRHVFRDYCDRGCREDDRNG